MSTPGAEPGTPGRSEPRQQRSREKRDRILAVTAQLLEELPYADIGTKLIAQRAEVSIGSLYRFFPDKTAIVSALLVHWLDRLLEVLDAALLDPPARPGDLIDRIIDHYAAFWRTEPGIRTAWVGSSTGATISAADARANDEQLLNRMYPVFTVHYALPGGPDLIRRLDIAIDVADHLLGRAFQDHVDGDPEVLAELKTLLRRYLAVPD